MDGIRAQSKAYKGYAIAARKLGVPCAHYRPTGAADPLAEANRLADLPAALDRHQGRFGFAAANAHGKPLWEGLLDGGAVEVGDYIVGPAGTFFVAAKQPLLPLLLVECNAVVSVMRPAGPQGVGAVAGYGGDVRDEEAVVAAGWPCSLVAGARGEASATGLPSEPRGDAGFAVLLPVLPGAGIEAGDFLEDERGSRYLVLSAEGSSLGWRLRVGQTATGPT